MKCVILSLQMMLLLTLAINSRAQTKEFNGAVPQPIGKVTEPFSQLRVKFPTAINKSALGQKEAFTVSCSPALEGFSSWADNDTLWTYNFKEKSQSSSKTPGGTKCQIVQNEALTSFDGKTWPAGTIDYFVIVSGPNVDNVYAAQGFKGTLREKEPVILIAFDGPIDRTRFFAEQNGFLNYLSANAPREKIFLAPVPQDQAEGIFSYFASSNYFDFQYKDQNWVLATIQQNLIPGADVTLTIANQYSSINADVHSEKKFTKEFSVRSQFQAEIHCANPSAKSATCLPRSSISVDTNGRVKWMDIKKSYIEYIPYKSTDRKLVRSYPELNQEVGLWESLLNSLAEYFPFLKKYSDTVVDSILFKVDIEPETQAKIVLPKNLTDIDGRLLSNAITEFNIRIGTMNEIIHVPQTVSIFEKNVPQLYLPVGIVNLNQKITIRKTGSDGKVWEPIQDVPSIINVIRSYEVRGTYRSTQKYISPLESLGIKNNVVEQQLTGLKNRPNFLQFPFAQTGQRPTSGFYPIEISSPTFETGHSDRDENRFYNPKYVLAQVTDMAVHIKKGQTNTLVWVTSLSEAQPLAGADVEIYNCLGQQLKNLKTNSVGFVTFPNQEWAVDCNAPKDEWSPYFATENFYVVARYDSDFTLVHSSWISPYTDAMSAPGVDWYYSEISENQPHFHSVVGVNLVKPGQQVPIELIAKLPHIRGFSEVPVNKLPLIARISNADDDDVYYELPLTWKNGIADIIWNVPNDSSTKLGRYYVTLKGAPDGSIAIVPASDIEVSEFKVPLMSGIISFPNQTLVRPDSIPVNSVIRYANGVGAKKLGLELSYYFEPTSIRNKTLSEFIFGNGAVKLSEYENSDHKNSLPSRDRPATIPGLQTASDGSISKDLAHENASDGRTISDILKTLDHPEKLVVRVRYQDQMGEYQTLSQAKDIFNANEYVGTNLVSGKRSQARLRVAVMDVNQKNITDLQKLEFKMIQVETKVIGEELYGGLIKNTLERELKPIHWQEDCVLQQQVVSCRIGSLKAGSYAFQVRSKTSKQAANTLFKVDSDGRVYGPHDYYHFGDDEGNKQLPLALNKKTYKEGDRAVVSFPTPFKNCRALVTLERSDVMETSVVTNACEKGFVEIPVKSSLAPNAFVSVYAITGRAQQGVLKLGEKDLGRPTYRLGYANLKVNWDRYKSKVGVKLTKEKYKPGDIVEGQVTVSPETGALTGGTVTVVAIEENILQLKKNETYKILDALMQLRNHSVETVSPLERVETVTAGNTDLPDDDSRKGGDEGGDGSSRSDFKRKLFNALVAFQPGIPVVNGKAQFSFKTNDSLTRFKIFVVATDSSQKFGTGEAVYLTGQDTQSFSNIPSVAHSGDTFPLKVTIQNNGKKAVKYQADVEAIIKDANGKIIARKNFTKKSDIEPSSSKAVDLGNIVIDEKAARIEYVIHVYDEHGNLVDSMEPDPQVILPSVPLVIHNSYIVQVENGVFTQELVKESSALSDKGEIRVTLSNSLVNGAVKQIQQRINGDMFADFFIESRFYKALLNSTEANPEELKSVLNSLIGSLDGNGFIKYYSQAYRGSVWLTANILNALQQESWSLKFIPAALNEKLKNAVSLVLKKTVDPVYIGTSPMDWVRAQVIMGRGAFAFKDANLQSLAKAVSVTIATELQRNPFAYGTSIDKWSNIDLVNVWLLQAFATPEVAVSSSLYAELIGPSRLIYTGNMAQLSGRPSYGLFYSDETIETANLLLGHALLHRDKDIARSLAVGLVNLNTKGWYNTSTMMSVAQGLKSFGRFSEAETVTGSAVLSVPEQQVNTSVDWSKTSSVDFTTPWLVSKATVQVTQTGQGNPWVGIQGLTAVPLTAPRGQGLAIEKEIRNVSREGSFQTGDVLEITLKINSTGNINNVALMDPIPAGSNILSDAYGSYSSGQKSYSGYKFYFDMLPSGLTKVKYQFQLNNPGTFKLPPTHAEALYTPSVFGETPNADFEIK
ncbi:MAG: alpha-2-macroglobulin family protein [Pseudobdellovibrionaceae bacterium]